MSTFLKASAAVLICVILSLVLAKQNKELSVVLTVAACCMVLIAMTGYLHPVIEMLRRLRSLGQVEQELFGILLKVIGIGLLSQICTAICADFGNAALGKGLQLLATAVILWISLPLLHSLLDLIEGILEAV